ncbi:similar to Saccharomyces cerevisiae YDR421W ARO80 Zinc finger transcriptional activator of the Zn2Cys6 family [Maudiozyma barnettii]|uniref:Similar to Saccharomyces cerevisiae YDR421W ARO80 Zinc finger transcriptional activator of the Zn2Cys6 family n=1 Tax=Maudiozyma barnettii TaxID=61262 RepID=A0A8H2VDY2_9SACH|nr:Aro80p [Kazachstania barnettii]CAB4253705.1 similar to Saccharomyces cerevisiae YDR421W ARO80 Zinc finger transcriptional activator of the Zn2Cys6 family [Kazachstania barnettii]CAD1781440.1 similar to Saccharomyces cerevisiae YDR421W ARO80 Zinc finger transcriptional activator of the Zn2Cys6 family [Kazachstania barnettii]
MTKETKVTKKQGRWRRSYKACLSCRARKVRCDLGPFDNPHPPPCTRCKREQRECLFTSRNRESKHIVSEDVSPVTDSVISSMTESATISKADSNNSNISEPTNVNVNNNITRQNNMALSNVITNDTSIMISTDNNNNKNTIKTTRSNTRNDNVSGEPVKGTSSINGKWGLGVTSMQNTLEFLANAAGSVAQEKQKGTGITQVNRHVTQLETGAIHHSKDLSGRPTPFLDPSDENIFAPLLQTSGSQRPASTLMEKVRSVRPQTANKLSHVDYIGDNSLLSEREAIELIDAFFLSMHPYFPNIPIQLHDAQELAEYPILLCAILTVSSRYHSFTEFGLNNGDDNKRNIDVHEKLWSHCQWMISQTIWAEASTRSIGTVLAFIILTEWNPRQIHFKKADYANNLYKIVEKNDKEIPTGIGAIRRSDRMAWMFTGTAVRLAQDMGFIETSTKIFVATHISDTFSSINLNQRPVLADTFSGTSLGMNNTRASGYKTDLTNVDNGVGNEKFFLDEILKNDDSKERWKNVLTNSGNSSNDQNCPLTDLEREFLNDEYTLYYSNKGDDIYEQFTPLPFALNFSHAQRAKIELVRITLVAYETIYYDQGKKKMSSNDQVHNLAVLDILSPLLDGWYGNYRDLLKPVPEISYDINIRKNKRAVYQLSQIINRESILSDYYYCQLYIYSLALQADNKEGCNGKLRINEIIKSAKYVELAYVAAKEILDSASRVHKIKMLKYMPVRWVIRVVRSVSFMVKCYLTLTTTNGAQSNDSQSILKLCCISLDETINIIRIAALILKEATPDELHLCVRYSAILLYLCKELKLKKKRNQDLLLSRGVIVNEGNLTERTKVNLNFKNNVSNVAMSSSNVGNKVGTKNISTNVTKGDDIPDPKNTLPHYTGNNSSNFSLIKVSNEDENNNPNYRDITNYQTNSDLEPNTSILNSVDYNNSKDNITSHANITISDNDAGYFQSLPDQVIDWFAVRDDIGLDFVEPWTQMIEQQYLQSNNDVFSEIENQPF